MPAPRRPLCALALLVAACELKPYAQTTDTSPNTTTDSAVSTSAAPTSTTTDSTTGTTAAGTTTGGPVEGTWRGVL